MPYRTSCPSSPPTASDILAELDREEEGVITATLDLDRVKRHRAAFGFFRDRRPELYGRLVQDI
jgi:N-carbamoylputrescine amidase